jgi:hypothetical protein
VSAKIDADALCCARSSAIYLRLYFASLNIKYDAISPISTVSEASSASNCNCIAPGE